MRDFIKRMLATGLGTGYGPIAPGTWGALGASAVYLLIVWLTGADPVVVPIVLVALTIAWGAATVATGHFAEKTWGKKDPGRVTADEWAGQFLTFLFVPMGMGWREWYVVTAVGFGLFRLTDTLKPPPAWRIQKVPYGWGILLDDLIAAVYANLIAQLLLRWLYFKTWPF